MGQYSYCASTVGPKGQAFKNEGVHKGCFFPIYEPFSYTFPNRPGSANWPTGYTEPGAAFLNKVLLGTAMPTPLRTVHSCFHTLTTDSVTHKA